MLGIGDFDKVNKKKIITREGQKLYMGKKYAQDKRTGYYTCTSGDRKRLHVAIWEHEHGVRVPPGCVIHHLDWNKNNNENSNLICVTVWEHEQIHNIIGGDKGKAYGYELIESRDDRGLPKEYKSDII